MTKTSDSTTSNGGAQRMIVAATFSASDGGTRAAGVLAGGVRAKLGNVAVFVVSPDGQAKFVESKDWGPGRGAVVGGAAGLIIGPLGALTLGGLGALAAKLRDAGFPDKDLEKLGRELTPGSSAIVADIAAVDVETARGLLQPLAPSNLVVTDIEADIARLFDEPTTV